MASLILERDTERGGQLAATAVPAEDRTGELWRDYSVLGGRPQRDRLLLHYAPLVRHVAARVGGGLPAHVDVADLVQCGVFGLIDAIERYEPDRGHRFETYAMQRIRGAIIDELRAQDWVPRAVRGRVRELQRAQERLEAQLQRAATAAELAAELCIDVEELRGVFRQIQLVSMEALDEQTGGGRGTSAIAGTLADTAMPDPVVIVQTREMRRLLSEAITQLAERDRVVVTLYYFDELTLADIGRILGVTESRVCQLHGRAVQRLRARLVELSAV